MNAGSIAGRVLIPAAVAIVLGLSRRYLPPSSTVKFTTEDANEFSRLQWVIAAGMLTTGSLFGYLSYYILVWANGFFSLPAPNTRFILLPSHSTWFFLPFFGAICLAWEITLRVWKLVGDPFRAQKYEVWANFKSGFDATRVLRIMILVIELPISVFTVLALPIHSSLTETGMSVGQFARLRPAEHSWSDVRAITVTEGLRLRDGALQKRPAIVLDFADGTRWSSADNRDPGKSIDQSLLHFVKEKTKLPVRQIEAFPFGSA